MTINYNLAVSTSKPWTLFKLLLKWRGSIWKAVILELAVWLMFYGILSIIYRTALSRDQQRTFERVVQYCDARLSYIPLNFMLGFFVTAVVNRWTTLYQIIGFIDKWVLQRSLQSSHTTNYPCNTLLHISFPRS
ncbi:unnamed protein product [Heligmosomoides polygyrus]|uniref:Bestrophin homolog n=1 Tax=Heligmosomoides polygyrus TaxID=6339 RepID=A0A183GQ97_HELPZ|nr:unnamed protein product [Heligmosomoides polygyrus]